VHVRQTSQLARRSRELASARKTRGLWPAFQANFVRISIDLDNAYGLWPVSQTRYINKSILHGLL